MTAFARTAFVVHGDVVTHSIETRQTIHRTRAPELAFRERQSATVTAYRATDLLG